jgi:hypothetical protein
LQKWGWMLGASGTVFDAAAEEEVPAAAAEEEEEEEPQEQPAPKRRPGRPKTRVRRQAGLGRFLSEYQAYCARMSVKGSDQAWTAFNNCSEEDRRKNQAEQARVNLMTPQERRADRNRRMLERFNAKRTEWSDPFEQKIREAKDEVRRRAKEKNSETQQVKEKVAAIRRSTTPLMTELLEGLRSANDPEKDLWVMEAVAPHVFEWKVPLHGSSRALSVLATRGNLPGAPQPKNSQRKRASGRGHVGGRWRERCKLATISEAGGPWPKQAHRETIGLCEAAMQCVAHKEDRAHMPALKDAVTTKLITYDRDAAKSVVLAVRVNTIRLSDSGSGSDTEPDEDDEQWYFVAFPMYNPYRVCVLKMELLDWSRNLRFDETADGTAWIAKLQAVYWRPGDDNLYPWVIRRRILALMNEWELAFDIGLRLPVPQKVLMRFGRLVETAVPLGELRADQVYVKMDPPELQGNSVVWTAIKEQSRLSKWTLPKPGSGPRRRQPSSGSSGPRCSQPRRKQEATGSGGREEVECSGQEA